jgi:hypothetical protein
MIISNAKIPDKIIYVDYGVIPAFAGHKMTPDGSYYVDQSVCEVFEYIDEANKIKIINNANQKYAKPIKIEVIDNTAINNVKLDCNNPHSIRCSVGGTYNVPFTKLSLLEAMKKSCTRRGGKIIGDFIWIKIDSELKLIRIGSDVHSAAISAISRRNNKKISNKELVPGSIYESSSGRKYLFVDFVDVKIFQWKSSKPLNELEENLIVSKKSKKLFFIDMKLFKEDKKLFKENNFEILKYRSRIQDNHSFVNMVGKLNLPKYFISNFRNYYRDLMKKYFIEVSLGNLSKNYITNYLVNYSIYFNLKKNKEVIKDFEYKKYLAFM